MINFYMEERKEYMDQIFKLMDISIILSRVMISVNIIQFCLIGTPFMAFSWILILILFLVKNCIDKKIDKLRNEEFYNWYMKFYNKEVEENE